MVLTVWIDLTPVKTTLAAAAQGGVGVVSTSQVSTGVRLVKWFIVSVIQKS